MSESAAKWLGVRESIDARPVVLGPATSAAMRSDPRMLGFILSRYKFVGKMLEGRQRVLEVGCGDAFGAPLVAYGVDELVCTDIDREQLRDNVQRMGADDSLWFEQHEFVSNPWPGESFDGAYAIDVLEHIYPGEERRWMDNVVGALKPHGVLLLGTPNITSQQYASPYSRVGHVNCKSCSELWALSNRYFHNTFLFSQHDEVVTTAYSPMAHYLWVMGVGVR